MCTSCIRNTVKCPPAASKKLLAEAGYPDGLEVTLAVGSGWPDVVRYAEILKQDAIAGGFKINLQTMPNSQYWEKWTEVDFGITPWTHRPLGTMVLRILRDPGKSQRHPGCGRTQKTFLQAPENPV